MKNEHEPAPWYNPELPGLHCALCAASVNLEKLRAAGVDRSTQIRYALSVLSYNHRQRDYEIAGQMIRGITTSG